MSYIFISYSRKDKSFVDRLVVVLEQRGINTWFDSQIEYGDTWTRVLQKKLDNCAAFIVIMTSWSYDSTWVQNELARAIAQEKTIIPLLLEGSVWLSVQTIQHVDVTDGNLPPDGFFEVLAKYTQSDKLQYPMNIIICFGVNIFELVEKGELTSNLPTDYHDLCDWLEIDLKKRVSKKIDKFEYSEPPLRTGEGLSIRIAFQLESETQDLNFDLGFWEILEIQRFEDIYPT